MHTTRHRLSQALVTAAMAVAVGGTLAWPPLVAHAQAVTPHFLPLPEQARPVAEPTIGYKVQRAGESGYVVIAGFVQDVEDSRAFWIDMWAWTKDEMGRTPFDADVEAGNLWAAQRVWFDRVANKVTARLVEKWGKRLSGVNTFTHDTVIAVIISVSTDVPNFPKHLVFD